MTAATEDVLAAQTRPGPDSPIRTSPSQANAVQANAVQASAVQASAVQASAVPTHTAQAHVMEAGIVQAGTMRTHQIFIRATPEEIWDALTRPGWTQLYGYRAPAQYEMRPGGAYRAFASVTMKMRGISGVIFDGEVIEADPPWRLVQTWHVLLDAGIRAEPDTRLSWEIAEGNAGVSTLTLTHDLAGAPETAALADGRHATAGGGWAWILSDLKTLLETGRSLAA
jgi:uncharacterized protein YndB with AHSA1/START domain